MNGQTLNTWLLLLLTTVGILGFTVINRNHSASEPSAPVAATPVPAPPPVDDYRDLRRESQRVALKESAIFLNRHLIKARSFGSKFELLESSLGSIPKELKGTY